MICFLVPRRLSWIEILVTTLFGLYFEALVNVYLDLKYDLYGVFNKGVDWAGLIPHFGMYPALSYLVLNFYPRDKNITRIIVYLLAWTIFSVAYECISRATDVLYYNGWRWWYSAIVYPLIFLILWYNLKFTRWVIKKSLSAD
ncbi:CBO0543 family protein [Cohnella thailandensis]